MSKFFNSDKSLILTYLGISLIFIGGSCFSLFANTEFNYYPIVIAAISFVFGFAYLLFMLKAANVQINEQNKKQPSVASLMIMNFLRFFIVILSIGSSVLFIYFGPRTGELPKWVFLLVLINGLPLMIDTFLFYMRSKFSE